jgi:hypothetical protein
MTYNPSVQTILFGRDVDQKITNQEVWTATLLFVGMDVLTLAPLPFVLHDVYPAEFLKPIGLAGAVFWGMLVIFFLFKGWDLYYRFFYPTWVRWFAPLDIPLYGAIGLGMWWLACQLPGINIFWFILFGGIEGLAEHVLGIYGFHILDKVPWLKDVKVLPALVFSIFEYIFYWTVVAWLAFGLLKLHERVNM